MSRVFVHGNGAVSPAGWGAPALWNTLQQGCPLVVQSLARPGWANPLRVRMVPPPTNRPAFLAHARLRRASPMSHYVVGAALEALGGDAERVKAGELRLGIVACTMTGGLSYSRRFYQEVMKDPSTASPLLFPETVFNAPASHLSAYLGTPAVNYTLVGDAGTFLQGLAVAAQWLEDGVAEGCVVVGGEESDWTAADALRLFNRRAVHASGAGALYLKGESGGGAGIELAAVTDSFSGNPSDAAEQMWAQLPAGELNELLCLNEDTQVPWKGRRVIPQGILGEAFAASAAWQCVTACQALQSPSLKAANISITGSGCQAIGARFVKVQT